MEGKRRRKDYCGIGNSCSSACKCLCSTACRRNNYCGVGNGNHHPPLNPGKAAESFVYAHQCCHCKGGASTESLKLVDGPEPAAELKSEPDSTDRSLNCVEGTAGLFIPGLL